MPETMSNEFMLTAVLVAVAFGVSSAVTWYAVRWLVSVIGIFDRQLVFGVLLASVSGAAWAATGDRNPTELATLTSPNDRQSFRTSTDAGVRADMLKAYDKEVAVWEATKYPPRLDPYVPRWTWPVWCMLSLVGVGLAVVRIGDAIDIRVEAEKKH